MSIAIERLKRAIADLPRRGMQTGSLKVELKLADAQRAIAELEGLKAERDALAAQLTDLIMAIAANYEFEITQGKPSKLAQEYLAEIRAEAVDDVWKKLHHRWKLDTHGDSAFVRVSEIKEMANTIRQGAE